MRKDREVNQRVNPWLIVAAVLAGIGMTLVGLLALAAVSNSSVYIPPPITCTPQPPICGAECYTPMC